MTNLRSNTITISNVSADLSLCLNTFFSETFKLVQAEMDYSNRNGKKITTIENIRCVIIKL